MLLNLTQTACLLGGLQALQLAFVALFWVKKNQRANRILALTLSLIGVLLMLALRRFGDFETIRYPLLHLWGTHMLLVSPLLYLYIRSSVGAYQFTARSALHFLPALLHLSLLLPLVWSTPATREALYSRYLELDLYRTFIPGVRIGALQAVTYWLGCFWWVRRLERHIDDSAAFSDTLHLRMLKWLTSLLVMLLVVLALGRLTLDDRIEQFGALAFALFLTLLNTLVLARPALLHSLPEALLLPSAPTKKYEGSGLDPEDKAHYTQQLLSHFSRERPYLQEDLTLNELAQRLKIPRSYLSQVINETQGKSFSEFVNDHRVEAAKTLLKDDAHDHLSVDGIALEVGFRTRSVFYNAFKKRTGKTPAAWRKQR